MKGFFQIASLALAANAIQLDLENASCGPTEQEALDYPVMTSEFEPFAADYCWEPHQVESDTGYIMTMFKVSPRVKSSEESEDVVFTHGYGQDPMVFMRYYRRLFESTGEVANLLKLTDNTFESVIILHSIKPCQY